MADNYIFTDDYGNFESYVVNNDGAFNLIPQIGVANTVINENTVINTNSIAMTNSTVNFVMKRPTAAQYGGLYLLTGNGYWTKASDIIASTSANTDGRFVWTNNHTFTNTITFNSVIVGTANNSNNLNGQPPTYYTNATNMASGTLPYTRLGVNVVNTTSDFAFYGIPTYNSNLVFTSTAAVIANGTPGTIGQVLMTNGTSVYWDGVSSAAVNVNTAYTFSNVIYFSNTVNFNSTVNFGNTGLSVSNGTFAGVVKIYGGSGGAALSLYNGGDLVLYNAANTGGAVWYCDNDGEIRTNGNTYMGGSALVVGDVISNYSDDRLKTRINNIDNALEKVLTLNGFYYSPNKTAINIGAENNQLSKIGVSAQEVQAVLPEADKPSPVGQGYLTVQYEKLIPLLIEAIKEQQEQINRLNDLINRG